MRRHARQAILSSEQKAFKAAEAEHVRIALAYRLAARYPAAFELVKFQLHLTGTPP